MRSYDENQDDICSFCSGSGENYFNTGFCHRCKGSGVRFKSLYELDDDDMGYGWSSVDMEGSDNDN